MTRKEMIAHYKLVVNAVFKAEDAINDKWFPILQEAKFHDQEYRERLADDYLTAIAAELVSKTSDEDLAKLND